MEKSLNRTFWASGHFNFGAFRLLTFGSPQSNRLGRVRESRVNGKWNRRTYWKCVFPHGVRMRDDKMHRQKDSIENYLRKYWTNNDHYLIFSIIFFCAKSICIFFRTSCINYSMWSYVHGRYHSPERPYSRNVKQAKGKKPFSNDSNEEHGRLKWKEFTFNFLLIYTFMVQLLMLLPPRYALRRCADPIIIIKMEWSWT